MSIDKDSGMVTLGGPTMGTRYSVTIPAAQLQRADQANLGAQLQAAVDLVDEQMSPWIEGSDLNRLNRAAVGAAVAVPQQMRAVLAAALVIGRESDGAFDVGVSGNVAFWGFGPEAAAPAGAPAPGPAKSAQGALIMSAKAGTVTKLSPVQVDLCGIAKGYGVDLLADVLEAAGLRRYMASIDGELRVSGNSQDSGNSGWAVGLERPEPGIRQVECVLHCTDLGLATSGGYRRFRHDGRGHVTHTIDPDSGLPLSAIGSSVTVAHESCALADAWATALMVMGPDRGMEFARQKGLHALFLTLDEDGKDAKRRGSGIMRQLCPPDGP